MSKPIDVFKATLKMYRGWFISNKENTIIEAAEKLADTQAIEFAKWIDENGWICNHDKTLFIKDEGAAFIRLKPADLLHQFKAEHYK